MWVGRRELLWPTGGPSCKLKDYFKDFSYSGTDADS